MISVVIFVILFAVYVVIGNSMKQTANAAIRTACATGHGHEGDKDAPPSPCHCDCHRKRV